MLIKNKLLEILRGTFLVNPEASRNWKLILFVSFLAVIMIAASHGTDRKIHKISQLNQEVKKLKNEFVALRTELQKYKRASVVENKLVNTGVSKPKTPARKIVVYK